MTRAQGLTDSKILALKAPERGQVEFSDAIVPGLRVRIGSTGTKTFILRKRVAGRLRNLTLGRYHERRFTLADARKKARALLSDIEAGGNPSPSKDRGAGAAPIGTVRALFADYRKAKAKLRSIGEIERIFDKRILPAIGDRMADAVTRADVTQLVDAIDAPVMARAVASQLSAFYSWAMPRLPLLEANPCRDAGKPSRPRPRERVLSDLELGAVWRALAAEPAPFGPAIRLLIITLQRRSEVFEADRAEFDRKARLWVVPAQRAKNSLEHGVPLSPMAIKELGELSAWKDSGKLFPAKGNIGAAASGISKAWRRIRKAVDADLGAPAERFTIHDLRRTGATGLQRMGVKLEVTEAILNHVSGSRAGIVGVYQRYGFAVEKRAALDAWAVEVARIARRKVKTRGSAG